MRARTRSEMRPRLKNRGEPFWPKIVLRKLLNISNRDSDFSADESDIDSQLDDEEVSECEPELPNGRRFMVNQLSGINENISLHRRRKSETIRAQYINTKEIRVCVGTWNVGGKLPSQSLDIKEWLNMDEPCDIYVIGLQEIVPLNAGNIFGAEDSRSVPRWESLIRETLNAAQPAQPKVKCYSDPPSPSRFQPSDDQPAFEDSILPETDSSSEEEDEGKDEESRPIEEDQQSSAATDELSSLRRIFSHKKLERMKSFRLVDPDPNLDPTRQAPRSLLGRSLSKSERVGLIWPEQPLNLLTQPTSSFKAADSFGLTVDLSVDSRRRRRSSYVRIISKQMVGVYLSIWVRRGLKKHIQNVKVSTVGVGVMGYIGNKGSISVSMSVYQTLFCFVCCHLTAGEKEGDEVRRNADVTDIHRRTIFRSPGDGMPMTIRDHERVVWLGDLNYRLNSSFEKTRELIGRKQWAKLLLADQLSREMKKGRAFDGWWEGGIDFAPTYKYEPGTELYVGDDPKMGLGRRTPAWCDRVLCFGKGMRVIKYGRAELRLSDHRPVAAVIAAVVEVFSHRKLQRALTFTDAEISEQEDNLGYQI
ncbi:type IV inositol polyphosphate 5-phosphatase 3-like [Wolffia australiana]